MSTATATTATTATKNAIALHWGDSGIITTLCTKEEALAIEARAIASRQEASVFFSETDEIDIDFLLKVSDLKQRVAEATTQLNARRTFMLPLIQAGLTNEQIKVAWNTHRKILMNSLMPS